MELLLHQPGEHIAQRYEILDVLGQGGSGITYRAKDRLTDQQVALKVLKLRQAENWKKIELFEREAQILSQLDHPAIPRYLDYFQVDLPEDRQFYIVQNLAEGTSLADLVHDGWRASEDEAKQIAEQVLEVLTYLHSLPSPVIHRDIKPRNLIQQDTQQIVLVDFGAVQVSEHGSETYGSTVVGTYGYMAPEQFRGKATSVTDLYGLAGTLLFLLTGRPPTALPEHHFKIDFRDEIEVSTAFANWLEMMLAPMPEDRFESAIEALAVLEGEKSIEDCKSGITPQPAGSKVKLVRSRDRMIINIPKIKLGPYSLYSALLSIGMIGFGASIMWLPFSPDVTSNVPAMVFCSGCGLPLITAAAIFLADVITQLTQFQLEINRTQFRLCWSLLGIKHQTSGNTADVDQVTLITKQVPWKENKTTKLCQIRAGLDIYQFGRELEDLENEWLMTELRDFFQLSA